MSCWRSAADLFAEQWDELEPQPWERTSDAVPEADGRRRKGRGDGTRGDEERSGEVVTGYDSASRAAEAVSLSS